MPSHPEAIALISPPWLLGPNGAAYMRTFGLALNELETKVRDASTAHMPGQSDASAIPFQAADRGLAQGPGETNDQFTARLVGALDAWRHAGSRRAILAQVHAYLTNLNPGVDPALPEARIVGTNGTRTTWDTYLVGAAQDAPSDHVLVAPQNWNWDGTFKPWRSWLILFASLVASGITGTAATAASAGGSGVSGVTSGFVTMTGMTGLSAAQIQSYLTIGFYTGSAIFSVNAGMYQIVDVLSATSCIIAAPDATVPDPGGTVEWSIAAYPYLRPAPVCGAPDAVCGEGSMGTQLSTGMSAQDSLQSIRNIVIAWKSAHAYYPNIIVSFGGQIAFGEFSPDSSAGSGNPDESWDNPGSGFEVNGVWVRSRTPLNLFTCFPIGTGRRFQCTQENIT